MPRIPDVSSLGARPTPDSGRGVYRPPQSEAGRGLITAGAAVQNVGQDLQNNADKFNYAKAKADYLTKSLEIDSQFQNDTDYKTLPQRYGAAQKAAGDAVLGAIPDAGLRSQLAVDLQSDMARQSASVRARANGLWKDDELGQAITQNDTLKKAFIQTGDEKYVTAVHDRWEGLKAAGVIGADVAAQKVLSDATDMTKGRLNIMPVDFRMKLADRIQPPMDTTKYASPAAAIQFVVNKLEDDGKGTVTYDAGWATKYGVSQKWNRDVDVQNLTKDAAYKILKERYWDKANIDMFPDNMKLLVFDAAVNQGPEKALTMAAMSGNDPEKFIGLRRSAYEQTVQDNPNQAKNLAGWNNRLNTLSSTATTYKPAGDIFDNLPPDYLAQEAASAKAENHQGLVSNVKSETRFADAATKTQLKSQYMNDSSVVNAIEANDKELHDDPAGFAAQSPNLSSIHDKMAKGQYQPADVAAYYEALKTEQLRMGVADQDIRYAPKSEVDDFKSALQSETGTADQVIKKLDSIKTRYGDLYPHVLGEFRNQKINGPYAVAAEMAGSGHVRDLVEAIKTGKDGLITGLLKQDDAKGIDDAVDAKLEDFTAAVNFPHGQNIANDYKQAVTLLALRHMGRGMSQTAAINAAADAIAPYNTDDTLVLPQGVDMASVKMAAEDYKSKLANMNILLPDGLAANTPKGDVWTSMIRDVKPVYNDATKSIMFFWPTGNPVLDKNKVQRAPGTGKITNLSDAVFSIPIADAVSNSQSVSTAAVKDEIVSDRAILTSALKRDVNGFYGPNASLEGIHPASAVFSLKDKQGYSRQHILSQSFYEALSPEQKAEAKNQIEANVKYNQMVLSRIPDAQKETFKKYVARSNAVAENYHYYELQIPPHWVPTMTDRQRLDLMAKTGKGSYLKSIGYQFLAVPEWAK